MSSYVIVDLEMCRVQDVVSYNDIVLKNEIIQIGAVRVNENLEIEESFMSYVHPSYGFIDPFIENLTGITYKDALRRANISYKNLVQYFPELNKYSARALRQMEINLKYEGYLYREDIQINQAKKQDIEKILKLYATLPAYRLICLRDSFEFLFCSLLHVIS